MSIIFKQSGLSDLTLERARLMPYTPVEITINQDRYLTESNNAKVIDYGDALELMTLKLKYLTKDNYDGAVNGLKTWFEDSHINWAEKSFSLVDENGVTNTVRLWQKDFKMEQASSGRYSIELTFKKE